MANPKYQIFISSTYLDLIKEREQVIKACLEMGHIPVGMEMFSAGDEAQWEIIKRCIDESDYYVVIVAHRYGSMIGDISFTEREYDYAIEQKIPVLGFIIDPKATWLPENVDNVLGIRKRLEAFKVKMKLKPVDFWQTADDLHGKCAIALMKAFNVIPRPGWVRASEVSGPEVITELTRLSSENAELRKQIDMICRLKPDIRLFADISKGDHHPTNANPYVRIRIRMFNSGTVSAKFVTCVCSLSGPYRLYSQNQVTWTYSSENSVQFMTGSNSIIYPNVPTDTSDLDIVSKHEVPVDTFSLTFHLFAEDMKPKSMLLALSFDKITESETIELTHETHGNE